MSRGKLPKRLDLSRLGTIVLLNGSHSSRREGVCALEAAAWLAGEEHSDHPACVWTAAWTAAETALAPTAAHLQESAVKLVERMIAVTAAPAVSPGAETSP